MTESPTEGDLSVNLQITETPEGTLVSRFLGMEPYLLVTVQNADEDEVSFTLNVGGGVPARPLDELAAFFEGLAEMIREGVEDEDTDTDDSEEPTP
jgi:hypothetical protein